MMRCEGIENEEVVEGGGQFGDQSAVADLPSRYQALEGGYLD